MTTQLIDRFQRHITDLRVSITDRCNFRCVYCMPAEGMQWFARQELLTYEEITRILQVVVPMGISKVRLTGGEPLVRKDVPVLIEQLARIEGLEDLTLTTNGFFLKTMAKDLANAGLRRINVSLDSLDRERFKILTRRDFLSQVLEGLEELEKYPSISPIKVNAVAMKGFTEPEVLSFARLAREKPYKIRFIEFMPLDADGNWKMDQVLTGREIFNIISTYMLLEPLPNQNPSSTSQNYRFVDGKGEIGFINPVSEPFCATCNRIRLTSDGKIRTCLFSHEETDLKTALRRGCDDTEIAEIFLQAVAKKEKKHYINDISFKRTARTMSQIGG